jgi:hypothetical protein
MWYEGAVHPRLFGIPATRSPVVAVVRRGPSDWSQVCRWDPDRGTFEPGSWIHANLYPQRCDISPDGRWLTYFTLRANARWAAGRTYIAVSRMPWLTALAAWGTSGTWERGLHFVDDRRIWEVGDPDEGDIEPLRERFRIGLEVTRAASFAVERRRGWRETADSPPIDREHDMWDERRVPKLALEKPRSGSDPTARLTVRGWYAAFRSGQPSWAQVSYSIVENGREHALEHVQWADWDQSGRLLVATTDGRLEIRSGAWEAPRVDWSLDLSGHRPEPAEPPALARRWV